MGKYVEVKQNRDFRACFDSENRYENKLFFSREYYFGVHSGAHI